MCVCMRPCILITTCTHAQSYFNNGDMISSVTVYKTDGTHVRYEGDSLANVFRRCGATYNLVDDVSIKYHVIAACGKRVSVVFVVSIACTCRCVTVPSYPSITLSILQLTVRSVNPCLASNSRAHYAKTATCSRKVLVNKVRRNGAAATYAWKVFDAALQHVRSARRLAYAACRLLASAKLKEDAKCALHGTLVRFAPSIQFCHRAISCLLTLPL